MAAYLLTTALLASSQLVAAKPFKYGAEYSSSNPGGEYGDSYPSGVPSGGPGAGGFPTGIPTGIPTGVPTGIPTGVPTGFPGGGPGAFPSGVPLPSGVPIPDFGDADQGGEADDETDVVAPPYYDFDETSWLEERQSGTCSTCILGGNPFVKLVKALIAGDGQTTDDCRMELYINMPDDAGGLTKGQKAYDGGLRINFEEDTLLCSTEVYSYDPNQENVRCIEGYCAISDVTDTSATVTWGGCYLPNANWYTDGQELKESDCIPMNGRVNFERHHPDKEYGCGNVLAQDVTLHNQVVGLDTILSEKVAFIGGNVQGCSALHA